MTKKFSLKNWTILVFILAIGSLTAQEEMNLPRFDKIVVSGTVDVILKQGETESAVLYTKNFDEDDVKITVDEGTLKINVLKALVKSHESIRVEVSYKQLRSIRALAGAEIEANNTIVTDYLEIKARSGSELELDVEADDLLVIASEGGQIELSGTAESQEVKAISGGEIHSFDLKTNYSYVSSNTGGLAEVVAKERVEASANTGGRVKYKGNPTKTKIKDFLGGSVREM